VLLGATLPEWLDVDTVRTGLLVTVVVVLLLVLLVARMVGRLVLKLVLLAALLAVAVAVWAQRAELGECASDCSCRLFGQDVQLSDDRLQRLCEERRNRQPATG